MRTLTISHRSRRAAWPARSGARPLTAGPALAIVLAAAALGLAACGGGGSVKNPTPKVSAGGTPSVAGSATPSAPQSFDPAQGPTQDPATLPKTCSGLVTDADIQLAFGQPLVGSGNVFTAYQPLPNIKQTKRVKCQYGVIQGADGKIQSDQIEVQVATYADAAAAQSRGAATVASMAAQGAKFVQNSIAGHPGTYVTEANDSVLVMFDGNRTFLITVNALLVKDEAAQKLAEKLGDALYKHVTSVAGPGAPAASGTPPTPGASGTPGAPVPSGSVTPGGPNQTPTLAASS
jgi:hypothetical protein